MSKTYVIGDIHGNYRGLQQVLERCKFNYDEDVLIQLGDICDGYPDVYECIELLLSLHPDRTYFVRGNHDEWFQQWIETGIHPDKWKQGGYTTLSSYCKNLDKNFEQKLTGCITNLLPQDLPLSHRNFFINEQKNYHIIDRKLFVHGGFNRHMEIDKQGFPYIYYWDRDLWAAAMSFQSMKEHHNDTFVGKFKYKDTSFDEIYIGHTSTCNWDMSYYNKFDEETNTMIKFRKEPINTPMKAANINNLDTGSGNKFGKLTIMNINDNSEYYQSDLCSELYPNENFR